MKLVLDANILFAALIKKSITTELLFNPALELYSCDYIIEEFFKYEELLNKKCHHSRENFIQILHSLKSVINVVKEEEYSDFISSATKITPDENDRMYFALSLKLKCPIWSNDKRLKNQDKVKIYSTGEIINILRAGLSE